MVAQLGQTTDPKQLVPGHPEQIAEDLRQIVGNLGTVGEVGGLLGQIDPQHWIGEASTMFRDAFGAEPPKWTELVDTVARGGQTLADFADVLAWGQGEAQRAIELHTQAQAAGRAATAQHQMHAAAGAPAPQADPGGGLLAEAQAVLDHARQRVDAAGTQLASTLGLQPDGQGGYSREHERVRERRIDRPWGGQQGLKEDPVARLVDTLGIQLPSASAQAAAGVSVAEGEIGGEFDTSVVGGQGMLGGSLLGASADAEATADATGASLGAGAEAHAARGSAEGGLDAGPLGVNGHANAAVEAAANANADVGLTGIDIGADAFAGGRADVGAAVEVAGVEAGVNAEGWAGAGAEAGAAFGMGEDGKFHVGGDLGIGLGLGGRLGGGIAIDPAQVTESVTGAADTVGSMVRDLGW
ncbi:MULTISPECIES: putative T7SS-secreted protein [Prauserella salsuginis group]|uniref:T7SS-secreted protein n=2 Tax=Prauserella salsuginis group TaxID=2893672 RepID=A0ABW6G571_9PSEU|nr:MULTISPECIES: hypothetical protein [Prauserella salsuginis group]MBB3666017.1 hypothetical protein [Prauserella sediminis]MCR3718909.1 hypothetical protein [Prauserella flava]MCR3733479.1 hypothetical protein [Prauserella salsuginis]